MVHLSLKAAPESFIVDDSDNIAVGIDWNSCTELCLFEKIPESEVQAVSDFAPERFKLVMSESNTEAFKDK